MNIYGLLFGVHSGHRDVIFLQCNLLLCSCNKLHDYLVSAFYTVKNSTLKKPRIKYKSVALRDLFSCLLYPLQSIKPGGGCNLYRKSH